MRFLPLCIILYTLNVRCDNSTRKDFLDLNDGEDHAFLWKNLFIKLNTVLYATEKINQNLLDVNKRLDDLTKRQESQEARLTKLLDNAKEIPAGENKGNPDESWNTILRRQDGSVNFARSWQDYKNGFGNLDSDFFIGLDRLHTITSNGSPQELMIVLTDFDNQTKYANYDHFRIGNESKMYALTDLGAYTGDAGDGMRHHKGQPFSTFDRDNNMGNIRNCAQTFRGGWWYFDPCYIGHLSGPYRNASQANTWGVSWDPWRRWNYSLKYAAMMIRSKQ